MTHQHRTRKLITPVRGDQLALPLDIPAPSESRFGFELLRGNSTSLSLAPDSLPRNNSTNTNLTTEATGANTNSHRWIEERWIERSGKCYGPYLYERWREGGKKRSRYLGKLPAIPPQ